MKTIKLTTAVFLILLTLSSCASFTISKDSLITQLNENQTVEKVHNFNSVGTGYTSNGLNKIKCLNKKGEEVWLFSGKNMNFSITNLSNGKTITMYFDTVVLENDTLHGLKSRILGGKRSISVNDIAAIKINVEEAKTEIIK